MNFIKIALNVIETEAQAISNLSHSIDGNFQKACQIILEARGKVIVTGVGKSGLVGKKISATLSSTGTPSIFLHPTEALHGDFGMIQSQDVVIAISHSGFTDELCKLLPAFQSKQIPVIAITSNLFSPLATSSTITLHYGDTKEACILGLAPTTSTTITLVLGDALAMALVEARQFNEKDFALNHPGGNLGRKLMTCLQLAHTGNDIPCVNEHDSILNALIEISAKKLGMTCITNNDGQLIGILTDGDVRRGLIHQPHIEQSSIVEMMTSQPKTIHPQTLATDALNMMRESSITCLIIISEDQRPVGVIHLHDLVKAGFSQ
jgi:arabinose-5-phosphate isomerase